MPPSPQQQLDRQARRRLAVLRHAEEVTGNVSQTCRYYGISRNCFYKWLRRYEEEGIDGLRDEPPRTFRTATTLRLGRPERRQLPRNRRSYSPEFKKISREVRRWRIHRWIGLTFAELARTINPVVAGWMHYYGRFFRSAMRPLLMRINSYLVRWIRNKYKRFRAIKKAVQAMHEATKRYPGMFRHWKWTTATSLT